MTTLSPTELEHVLGSAGKRGLWPLIRDGFTAAMSYWTGEQLPEIERPQPNPQGIHDTRPPPKPPKLPSNIRIRR